LFNEIVIDIFWLVCYIIVVNTNQMLKGGYNMTKTQTEKITEISSRFHGTIPVGRVFAIAYMAANDICPDGSFSDDECIIWETFKTGYR